MVLNVDMKEKESITIACYGGHHLASRMANSNPGLGTHFLFFKEKNLFGMVVKCVPWVKLGRHLASCMKTHFLLLPITYEKEGLTS